MTEQQDMDQAAEQARLDLEALPVEHRRSVARWWSKHFAQAGHKRLGRLMVEEAKKDPTDA